MGVVTINPDAAVQSGNFTLTGGTLNAILADASDATYAMGEPWDDTQGESAIVGMGDPAIPGGALIKQLRVKPRIKDTQTSGGRSKLRVRPRLNGVNGTGILSAGYESVITDYVAGWETSKPGGGPWLAADVNALQVMISGEGDIGWWWWDPTGTGSRIYKLAVEVEYNEKPVVTVSAPTGTVDSSQPALAWSHTDAEGDPQQYVEYAVFTAAQYGIGGFDPATSPATYRSGKLLTASQSVATLPVPLTNAVHRLYVRVYQPQVSGQDQVSAWAFSGFTVDVAGPAAPSLTATAQPTTLAGRVALDYRLQDNWVNYTQSTFEDGVAGIQAAVNGAAPAQQAGQGVAPGTNSLRMRSSAAGDMIYGAAAIIPIAANQTWQVRASVKAATAARQIALHVWWYNAGGGFIGSTTSANLGLDATGAFTEFVWDNVVPPAGAVGAAPFVIARATGAANEDHYVDHLGLFFAGTTAWARGGMRSNSSLRLIVEYSDDGGTTWTVHPDFDDLVPDTAWFGTLYDYESVPAVARRYRARVAASIPPAVTSPYSATAGPVTITPSKFALKDPISPALNVADVEVFEFEPTFPEPAGVSRPLERYTAVVTTEGRKSMEGRMSIRTKSAAARQAIEAITGTGRSILVVHPVRLQQWYLKLIESHEWPLVRAADPAGLLPLRDLHEARFSFVETDRPTA